MSGNLLGLTIVNGKVYKDDGSVFDKVVEATESHEVAAPVPHSLWEFAHYHPFVASTAIVCLSFIVYLVLSNAHEFIMSFRPYEDEEEDAESKS